MFQGFHVFIKGFKRFYKGFPGKTSVLTNWFLNQYVISYNYPTQYSVFLSQEEKEKLLAMSKDNKLSARVSKSVLILLALDNKTNSDIVD